MAAGGFHVDIGSMGALAFWTALGAILPLAAGVGLAALVRARGGRLARFLPAFSFGVALFLFADLLALTADLGRGTRDLETILPLMLAFAAGVGLFAALARGGPGDLALAWAFGLGLHGLGEGLLLAFDFRAGALHLDFFQGASFALHKLFEGASIVALLGVGTKPPARWHAHAVAIAGAPVVLGLALPGLGATGATGLLVFALGAGANALALLALGTRSGFVERFGTAAAMAAGALILFAAGILHEH